MYGLRQSYSQFALSFRTIASLVYHNDLIALILICVLLSAGSRGYNDGGKIAVV